MEFLRIITQNISDRSQGSRVIKEGDTAFIRILKDLGEGRYLASIGGNRMSVQSQKPLSCGQTFRATISFKDGKLVLDPSQFKTEEKTPLPSKENSAISFLQKNGFATEGVNLKIIEFLMQSGVSINKKKISRALKAAADFPGKEEEAAETGALLEEKGIEPVKENILRFMMQCSKNSEEKKDSQSSEKEEKQNKTKSTVCPLFDEDETEKKEGILTLSNHLKNTENDLHWITLPFEWNCHGSEWNGEIRVLINTSLKSTEKIKIKCSNLCKNYSFMLYFRDSKVSEVRFCTLPPLLTYQIPTEEKRLGELFCSGMNDDSVAVIYSTLAFD